MKKINGLNNSSRQKISFVLEDNSVLDITIEFKRNTKSWSISFSNNDFVLNNNNLAVSPNFLRKYRNIINFGLAVVSNDGLDPAFVDDFENERIVLYVLNASDVSYVEGEFYA